jgi:hypothetical protein
MKCALEILFALVAFFVIRLYRGRMTKKDGVFGMLPRVAAAPQPYPGLLSAASAGLWHGRGSFQQVEACPKVLTMHDHSAIRWAAVRGAIWRGAMLVCLAIICRLCGALARKGIFSTGGGLSQGFNYA